MIVKIGGHVVEGLALYSLYIYMYVYILNTFKYLN